MAAQRLRRREIPDDDRRYRACRSEVGVWTAFGCSRSPSRRTGRWSRSKRLLMLWVKRRWRCIEAACETKTWTELSDHVDAQAVVTRRAPLGCRTRHRRRHQTTCRTIPDQAVVFDTDQHRSPVRCTSPVRAQCAGMPRHSRNPTFDAGRTRYRSVPVQRRAFLRSHQAARPIGPPNGQPSSSAPRVRPARRRVAPLGSSSIVFRRPPASVERPTVFFSRRDLAAARRRSGGQRPRQAHRPLRYSRRATAPAPHTRLVVREHRCAALWIILRVG